MRTTRTRAFALLAILLGPLPVAAQSEPPAVPPAAPAMVGNGQGSETDESFVLVGAGDIANCEVSDGHIETARLLDDIPGTVFTTGDHAYPNGATKSFNECYGVSWGRHKERTRPSPGNHDLRTKNGRPYYEYFGENAGPRGLGYYSYDLGSWHIISLNSGAPADRRSKQIKWLRKDLEENQAKCTLAYWHVPAFSSGAHGNHKEMLEAWRLLYASGAEVIVNGHDHDYERFSPQDPKGQADAGRGIREFVVGTGGGGVYRFKKTAENSEVRNWDSYGVIKFTLYPDRYDWEFITAKGEPFTDSGSAECHL